MNDTPSQKKDKAMLIVAINVAVMIAYTLYIRITDSGGNGVIVLAFIMAIHVLLCLIISPFKFSKGFVLSALAVLLIGFSTCYLAYSIH
jgi:hypothetical protein